MEVVLEPGLGLADLQDATFQAEWVQMHAMDLAEECFPDWLVVCSDHLADLPWMVQGRVGGVQAWGSMTIGTQGPEGACMTSPCAW